MYCVPHLLRNIKQHKATRLEKALEKSVTSNHLCALQDSASKDVFETKLANFGKSHPNTMEYLKAIPPERWVKYAQVVTMQYALCKQ
jgi:hypothetical protein